MSLDARTHMSVGAEGHIVPLHEHSAIYDSLAGLSHYALHDFITRQSVESVSAQSVSIRDAHTPA